MLKSYLKNIFKIANQGDAREESYYSTLESLLEETAQSFGKTKNHITTLPKTTEAGKRVEKIKYGKEGERVYINNDQYFEGLEENIWQYRIGGYQVCDKWLKDRKGRVLSLEDIKHYCKTATAIEHTINIQKCIDVIYDEVEKELIGF